MKNVTFDFTPEMHDTELIHYVSTTIIYYTCSHYKDIYKLYVFDLEEQPWVSHDN